jgi:poly(hydroxyalkanoate) granule-associated protein
MATDVKQAIEESVAEVEKATVAAKKTVKKAAKEAEQTPVVEAVKEAAGNGKGSVIDQVKDVVKDVAEKAEKNPVTVQVRKTMKETAKSVQQSPFVDMAHKVLLAGIGAAALAQDEMEDFVNRLVERGEIAEADGRKMLKDVMEKRKKIMSVQVETAPKKIVSDFEKHIEEVLGKMNIPSKDEIEALGAKITALTKKVDELKKSA